MAKITLTNRQIAKGSQALAGLDGVMDGGKFTRFKFDSDLSWQIACITEIVESAVRVIERERKRLGAQFGVVEKMELTKENAAAVASYIEAEDQLQDKTQVLEFTPLSRKALQEKNAIPPTVLTALKPFFSTEASED